MNINCKICKNSNEFVKIDEINDSIDWKSFFFVAINAYMKDTYVFDNTNEELALTKIKLDALIQILVNQNIFPCFTENWIEENNFPHFCSAKFTKNDFDCRYRKTKQCWLDYLTMITKAV